MKKESLLELLRYGITGAATTAVNYVVYIFLLYLNWNYLVSNTIAWMFAVTFAYIVNRKMVFHSQNRVLQEAFSFVSMRFITLLLENLLLFCFIQQLHFPPLLSKLAVSIVTIIGNYVICKCHIFVKGAIHHE
ncbi:GtrA family protein [Roseburia sp. 499]|uniref:GtrA family protein n=1 Tax=Roseburia sp. 499 TaxID=1261634 RepID=UPI000952A77E|nr:GtrA family protein [Roseburia sp. 499]WVK70286.1 GtrA family protein [Roseburia sp. 499]